MSASLSNATRRQANAVVFTAMQPIPFPDIDELWNYGDPTATEQKFQELLDTDNPDHKCEILTQIARTHSLRRNFEKAHEILDTVNESKSAISHRTQVRYLLERGRTYNSAGQKDEAKALFTQAFELGSEVGDDTLTIDAAHMVAIAGTPEEALDWNKRGLALAQKTTQPKAEKWVGSITNNLAWTYHDRGDYTTALEYFMSALAYFERVKREPGLRIARWAVARCARSLGQYQKAIDQQLAIAKDYYPQFSNNDVMSAPEEFDGYVAEEIAEGLLALGRKDEAKPYFGLAYERLGRDQWFVANEAQRLERLKALSE